MSYRNLQIWQLARTLTIDVHKMSLALPAFEKFEEGSQIRRSVRSNIVEGYGRRKYKNDYIKFMIYAQASNDETIDHLEILYETKSLTDEVLFKDLQKRTNELGIKINYFIQSLERGHNNFEND